MLHLSSCRSIGNYTINFSKKRAAPPFLDRPSVMIVREEDFLSHDWYNYITMKNNRNMIIISTWNLYWLNEHRFLIQNDPLDA